MKMKKLFAIAALLLGSTSVFAAPVLKQDYTYQGLVYGLYIDGTTYTAKVKSIADDDTYKAATAWEIPAKFKALAGNGANGDCAGKEFTVVGIGEAAFANSKLTTLTFAKAENITEIGAGAFTKTSITSLDLSSTKIATLEELFETVNTKVKTIKLPATLATIQASAFEGLSVLKSIVFSNTETGITINASAFKNTMALKTLSLPAVKVTLKANAFDGSYISTLTFNGDVAAEAASFKSANFSTINFKANLSAANAIVSGAFVQVGSQKITVNYSPTEATAGFHKNAFGADDANKWATFVTTETFGKDVCEGLGWTTATTGKGFGVILSYTATIPDPTTIAVTNKEGSSSSYYYGTWYSTTKSIKIAKSQKDAGNVMVYGAYVDNPSDGSTAIMMDQLTLIGGYYYVPKETPVIVKASKKAAVVYTENDDATKNSVKYASDKSTPANQIKPNGEEEVFAKTIIDGAAGKVVYFLAPIEEYGFLWSEFNDNTIVAPYGFYIYSSPVAATGRLNVIWLDGSEEDQATAIKAVKTVAEKGAIYNLAGQKVNAAYKGVVIKDGKKYIQK
jgi:hypothetical protein